jgi:LmbE family N-acetylglucosaminyl deacetylase
VRTLIVAPHPDDEVLGAGGTLLRRKKEGVTTACLFLTRVDDDMEWSEEKIARRSAEIEQAVKLLQFDSFFQLDFPARKLDVVPMNILVEAISRVFSEFEPTEVFVPHPSDIHSDHRVAFQAAMSCTKWFRFPFIKRVLAYETLSETDFGLEREASFRPNVFLNIEDEIEEKLLALKIYSSEIGEFPFPRSTEAVRALATVRGAASGYSSAEAFELLRERD